VDTVNSWAANHFKGHVSLASQFILSCYQWKCQHVS